MSGRVVAAHGAHTTPHIKMAWHGLAFDGTSRERLGVDAGHFRGDDDRGMLLDSGQSDVELLTSWREVAGMVFAAALPSPLAEPTLICHSTSALLAFGVTVTPTAAELCGNELPHAALPAAHCYAGHQFGNFAGQLGDGAAISLGEAVTPSGELRELGFKGTGPTPFTQEALTGRKQVGSMVVELIVAEALAALGVPTARGLGVVTGAPTEGGDACAVLTRSATSFLRFGSLEVCLPHHHDRTDRHAPSAGDTALLQRLADHCIASYGCFRQIAAVPDDEEEEDEELRAAPRYCELVLEIARRTARLTAAWQLLGECHGMLDASVTLPYTPALTLTRRVPRHAQQRQPERDGRDARPRKLRIHGPRQPRLRGPLQAAGRQVSV